MAELDEKLIREYRQHIGIVSEDDLAEILGTTKRVLYELRKSGTGPKFIRVKTHVFYRFFDVSVWLAAQTKAQSPETGAPEISNWREPGLEFGGRDAA